MTREQITENLKEIMKYTVKNADEVLPKLTDASDLYTDLGLTSVGMLYSVIAMEETFGMTFDGVEIKDFRTVGDVVNFIEKKSSK